MNITDQSEDIYAARQREANKAAALRAIADARWTQRDLLEIFGLCMAHRARTEHKHERMGQNFFSNHFHAGAHNPTGSKLMRRFIRANGARSASWEREYKAFTGRRYNHLNLGEDEEQTPEAAA